MYVLYYIYSTAKKKRPGYLVGKLPCSFWKVKKYIFPLFSAIFPLFFIILAYFFCIFPKK